MTHLSLSLATVFYIESSLEEFGHGKFWAQAGAATIKLSKTGVEGNCNQFLQLFVGKLLI
jgi:hypothetical protein